MECLRFKYFGNSFPTHPLLGNQVKSLSTNELKMDALLSHALPPVPAVTNAVGAGGGPRSVQPKASPPPKARTPDHTR